MVYEDNADKRIEESLRESQKEFEELLKRNQYKRNLEEELLEEAVDEVKGIEVRSSKGTYTTDALASILENYAKRGGLTSIEVKEPESAGLCKFGNNDFFLYISKKGDSIVTPQGTSRLLFKEAPYFVMKDSKNKIYFVQVKLNEDEKGLTAYLGEGVDKIDENSEILAIVRRKDGPKPKSEMPGSLVEIAENIQYIMHGKNKIVEIVAKKDYIKYLDLDILDSDIKNAELNGKITGYDGFNYTK